MTLNQYNVLFEIHVHPFLDCTTSHYLTKKIPIVFTLPNDNFTPEEELSPNYPLTLGNFVPTHFRFPLPQTATLCFA